MPKWLLDYFGPFLKQYVAQRLALPTSAYAQIEADSAQYTSDNQPLTADQLQAADKAIIDYIMGRVLEQAGAPVANPPTS